MSKIIYLNHDATLNIAKQIILTISSTNKFNLRLVRASNYIQRFSFKIRNKSEKLHIVSDTLSRLFTVSVQQKKFDTFENEELDVLYTESLIEINSYFKNRILQNYKNDFD